MERETIRDDGISDSLTSKDQEIMDQAMQNVSETQQIGNDEKEINKK